MLQGRIQDYNLSEEMYHNLIEESQVGFLTCDLNGEIQYMNSSMINMLGLFSFAEKNIFALENLEEYGITEKVRRCIEEKTEKKFEVLVGNSKVEDLCLKVHIAPLMKEEVIKGLKITMDDITDFMKKETESKKEDFILMFRHLSDAVWVINREGFICYANPMACKDSGYTLHELVGMGLYEIEADLSKDEFPSYFEYMIKEKQLHHIGRSKRKDGTIFDIELHAIIMEFDGEQLAVCTTKNNSERSERSQEIIKIKEEVSTAKAHFLSNMTHEIRTPINGMLGFLQLLQSTNLSEEQMEYIKEIKESNNRLLRTIDDILDMTEIAQGSLVLEIDAFAVLDKVEACIEIAKEKAEVKGLDLIPNTAGVDVSKAKGDVHRICQIVSNLLDNAIKFTERGYIAIEVYTKPLAPEKAELVIIVRDSGVGMERSQLNKLRAPFEQSDISFTRKYGGTGLGLTITSALLDKMGGKFEIQSDIGKGTKVEARIPLLLEKAAKAELEEMIEDILVS